MTSNTSKSLIVDYNIQTEGNVSANYFIGDGSQLTNINGVSASLAKFTRTTDQTGVNANSVVICNVQESSVGTDILVDTTTGNITLQAGKTYRLRGTVGYCNTTGTGVSAMSYQWFNATTSKWVGQGGGIVSASSGATDSWQSGTAEFVFTSSATTVVQLRVVGTSGSNAITPETGDAYATIWRIGSPFIDIEVIGGQSPINNVANYGIVTGITNAATTTSTTPSLMPGSSFTLTTPGTYDISYLLTLRSNTTFGSFVTLWNVTANTAVNGSSTFGGYEEGTAGTYFSLSGSSIVTISNPTTFAVYWASGNAGATSTVYNNYTGSGAASQGLGDSTVTYNQVAGLLPTDQTNLVTKASGIVAAGVDVTLGNLRARIPTSGNRSLQVSTVSGTYSVYGSAQYTVNGTIGGTNIIDVSPLTVTTTPAYLKSSNNFAAGGDSGQWLIFDTTAGLSWRISFIIGNGYVKNMITIEQLT